MFSIENSQVKRLNISIKFFLLDKKFINKSAHSSFFFFFFFDNCLVVSRKDVKTLHYIITLQQEFWQSQSPYTLLKEIKAGHFPANISLFKVSGGNTRTMREVCSKLTLKTPDQPYWHHSGVITAKHISCIVLMLPLLILNKWMLLGWTLNLNFKKKQYFCKSITTNLASIHHVIICNDINWSR